MPDEFALGFIPVIGVRPWSFSSRIPITSPVSATPSRVSKLFLSETRML